MTVGILSNRQQPEQPIPHASLPGEGGKPPQLAANEESARWDPIIIDRPSLEFEPKPPVGGHYRPDTEFDGWSTDHVSFRMASVRGYRHRYYGKPRQDHAQSAVHTSSGTVVFAVADGVSSAAQAEEGAVAACVGAVNAVLGLLDDGVEDVQDWMAVLRSSAAEMTTRAASLLGTSPSLEDVERLLATTLVVGTARPVAAGLKVNVVRVGDSGVWKLDLGQRRYNAAFAAKDDLQAEVVSNAVWPMPRVLDPPEQAHIMIKRGNALLVGTDGFGDPLGDGDGRVGQLFSAHLSVPPPARRLAHVLDFSRETFDDDRTLLVLWPRAAREGR